MQRCFASTGRNAWRHGAVVALALVCDACTFVGAGISPFADAAVSAGEGGVEDAGAVVDASPADTRTARDDDAPTAEPPAQPALVGGFVSIDVRVQKALADVRALPNPADRKSIRYIDLSALANAGKSDAELEVYREAVSFLINSLSRARVVTAPRALDEGALLLRVDLRDYLWQAEAWRALEQSYPYAAVYHQDSRLFPVDEASSQQLRDETGTQIPILQADWFIAHAIRPPLYYQLLSLPASLAEFATQLGVDFDGDVAAQKVLRAGFKTSVPAPNNRMIERHARNGNQGALWRSYDFLDNLDKRNIFAHPLDFQADGSELSFALDNGLEAYFIADATGERLEKVPNDLLRDPSARDGAAEAGLSCMSCHQVDGVLAHYDEVRDLVRTTSSAAVYESVAALYGDPTALSAAFDSDQSAYRAARDQLGLAHLDESTLHALDDAHFGVLDLTSAASVLGIEATALKRALDAAPQTFPVEVAALRADGGGIQRDAFDALVGDVFSALGLGTQLRVAASSP